MNYTKSKIIERISFDDVWEEFPTLTLRGDQKTYERELNAFGFEFKIKTINGKGVYYLSYMFDNRKSQLLRNLATTKKQLNILLIQSKYIGQLEKKAVEKIEKLKEIEEKQRKEYFKYQSFEKIFNQAASSQAKGVFRNVGAFFSNVMGESMDEITTLTNVKDYAASLVPCEFLDYMNQSIGAKMAYESLGTTKSDQEIIKLIIDDQEVEDSYLEMLMYYNYLKSTFILMDRYLVFAPLFDKGETLVRARNGKKDISDSGIIIDLHEITRLDLPDLATSIYVDRNVFAVYKKNCNLQILQDMLKDIIKVLIGFEPEISIKVK